MLLKAVSCTLNTPHLVHVERDHPCRQVYDGVLRDLSKGGGRDTGEIKRAGNEEEGREAGWISSSLISSICQADIWDEGGRSIPPSAFPAAHPWGRLSVGPLLRPHTEVWVCGKGRLWR